MSSSTPGTRRALGNLLTEARCALRPGKAQAIATVAERAGVGVTWYEWLEAGRNISLSTVALGWVADALELSERKRAEILTLAGLHAHPRLSLARAELVPPRIRRLLDGLERYPAYAIGQRGDVLAWNGLTEALYGCSVIPPAQRNTLVFLFLRPEVRHLVVNWEEQARYAVDTFRVVHAARQGDEWIEEIRVLLTETSAEFRGFWEKKNRARPHSLTPLTPLTKVFQKRSIGRLTFQLEEVFPSAAPDLRIAIYVPDSNDGTAAKLERLTARQNKNTSAEKKRAQRRAVFKVKEHLDECSNREVPLDELAALASVEKFPLLRTFASEVGFPPHAYQMLVRIHRAKELLIEGEAAMAVAAAVGFTDQSHLIRHFKRVEGITPAQFVQRTMRRALRQRAALPPNGSVW